MALAAILYGGGAALLLPASGTMPIDLGPALSTLWSPVSLLLMQSGWLAIFLYTGRSMITGSHISFHVHRHRT